MHGVRERGLGPHCVAAFHCQRQISLNQENFQILNCPTKFKSVTTQMKALNEYFLIVLFILLLNKVHVFAIFMFNFNRETAVKGKWPQGEVPLYSCTNAEFVGMCRSTLSGSAENCELLTDRHPIKLTGITWEPWGPMAPASPRSPSFP